MKLLLVSESAALELAEAVRWYEERRPELAGFDQARFLQREPADG